MPPFPGFPSPRLPRYGNVCSPRPTSFRILRSATLPANSSQIRCLRAITRLSRGPYAPCYLVQPSRSSRNALLLHPRLSCARSASYSSPFAQPRSYSSSSSAADVLTPTSSAQSERPEPPDYLDEKERAIFDRLKEALDPVELQVEDISGGCGSMYAVAITASKFKGLPVIKQHRLVNQVLGEEIKSWHGIQLRTKAP